MPGLLRPPSLVFGEQAAEFGEVHQDPRVVVIPQEFKLRDRFLPFRASRMTRGEGHHARLRTRGRPPEVMVCLKRLSLIVDSEKTNVEVITREHEVIRIAS